MSKKLPIADQSSPGKEADAPGSYAVLVPDMLGALAGRIAAEER